MTDPSRLVETGSSSAFEIGLLRSASLDREPADGAARALGALGLEVSAGVSAMTPKASATPSSSLVSTTMTMKLTALVSVLGCIGIVGGAAIALFGPTPSIPPPAKPAAPVATTSSALAFLSPDVPPAASADIVVVDVASLPTRPPPIAVRKASGGSAPSPVGASSTPAPSALRVSLSEELVLVDRARRSIDARDFFGADTTLSEYETRFPDGALQMEAELARIELSFARNDSVLGRARGERFIAQHPSSMHVRRVRALLQQSSSQMTIP